MTNGLTRPLQQQQQSLPRSQSTTPSTARKNAPSPTPQFDARKLRNGMTLNFEFSCQKYYRNTCNMSHSVPFCKMLKSNLNQNESNWSQIWIKMCEFGVKSVKIQIRCPIMHPFSYKILYALKELLGVTVDLGWLFGECWKDLWFMSDCLLIRRSVEQNCCWHLQF